MNVSAISSNDSDSRRNLFIQYANHFMGLKASQDGDTETVTKPINAEKKVNKTMGIETLTIFPKQVVDGKTIITA
jgi:hypothetical protein